MTVCRNRDRSTSVFCFQKAAYAIRIAVAPHPRTDGGASHLWLDGHSDLVHPFSSRTRKLSRSTLTVVLSCASRREKSSLSTSPSPIPPRGRLGHAGLAR